jgi:hypothetical protein
MKRLFTLALALFVFFLMGCAASLDTHLKGIDLESKDEECARECTKTYPGCGMSENFDYKVCVDTCPEKQSKKEPRPSSARLSDT